MINMTPTKICTLWGLCIVVSISWVEPGVPSDIGEDVKAEVSGDINTITRPIDSAVLTTATNNCETVKQFFGISYEELDNKQEPDLNTMEIYFKTKEGQTIYNINQAAKKIPKNPSLQVSYKTILYIPGFNDNPNLTSFVTVGDALLTKGGYNVLALDASNLIKWPYLKSSTYVRFVGERLGEVIAELSSEGIKADDITIIGHSLGAHIASYAAKKYTNLTSELIGRLTGLDPAGPCFENLKDDLRLKKTDAKFVDVIHTDAGVYGITDSLGQVDYFPNGGFNQPDCLIQVCSHFRAWELYASTLTDPELFPAVKCKSWDHFKKNECNDSDVSFMGYGSTPKSFGNYYLVTKGEAPYGLGKEGLNYTGGFGALSKIGYKLIELHDRAE